MTANEINRAINERIRAAMDGAGMSGVPLSPEDLSEPIVRPSVKVSLSGVSSGRFNGCEKETTLACRVYFFARDRERPKAENTSMRELLECAFLDDLAVGGGTIPIEKVESEISDGVLICSFDLYRVELLPEPEGETMEILNLNERVV